MMRRFFELCGRPSRSNLPASTIGPPYFWEAWRMWRRWRRCMRSTHRNSIGRGWWLWVLFQCYVVYLEWCCVTMGINRCEVVACSTWASCFSPTMWPICRFISYLCSYYNPSVLEFLFRKWRQWKENWLQNNHKTCMLCTKLKAINNNSGISIHIYINCSNEVTYQNASWA